MKYTVLLIYFSLIFPIFVKAQDTTSNTDPSISLEGFIDVYYAFDFNQPSTNSRQGFLFHHNRHNEFNLNLGLIRFSTTHKKYRACLGLQVGTYADDNYSNESKVMRHVYEATAGLSLNKKNNLWVDAGVFSSHLGFESAISIENLTLSRSLAAENSPYFLTGAKITYNPAKWSFAVIVSNGWQRIQRLTENSLPSFGTQVYYNPNSSLILNWSSMVGTDDPDSTRRIRIFNNFYTIFNLSSKTTSIIGFDIGVQQRTPSSNQYHYWYVPTIILNQKIAKTITLGMRGEYFNDPQNVIVDLPVIKPFSTYGFSINMDYSPFPEIAARLEIRHLYSPTKIFFRQDAYIQHSLTALTSIAVKL